MDQNLRPKIKIGIVGGSFDSTIAKTHFRAMHATNKFKIVCGCFSRKKNKNITNANFYSLPMNKVYNNFKKFILCENKNIDLALVLTPPVGRSEIYSELAKKKIGIIFEKPFEANFENANKIYEILKKKNIFITSTYNYLGYPAIMEIKPLLRKIGKINNVVLNMPQQGSTLYNNFIKKWRTKDLIIPNLYLDLGSHLLSLIIYFFNKLPIKVNSFETKNTKKPYVDNTYVWLMFKDFPGQLWFSKNSTGKRNELSIEIFGSKGGLKWEHSKSEIIKLYDSKGNINVINRLTKKTKYLKNNNLFTYSAGHPSGFLDAFINIYNEIYSIYKKEKNKSQILLNLKNNLDIINILQSIHQSAIKQKWQKIKLNN